MKTFTKQRTLALGTLAVFGATAFSGVAIQPAHASSKTWKNIALGAGAVTAYGLLKGKGKIATIGGIATVGSYLKYRSEKKKEKKIDARKVQWYKQRYGRYWRNHYVG